MWLPVQLCHCVPPCESSSTAANICYPLLSERPKRSNITALCSAVLRPEILQGKMHLFCFCCWNNNLLFVCVQLAAVITEGRCLESVMLQGAVCAVRGWTGSGVTAADVDIILSQTARVRKKNCLLICI